jgi:ribosomal protein L21E
MNNDDRTTLVNFTEEHEGHIILDIDYSREKGVNVTVQKQNDNKKGIASYHSLLKRIEALETNIANIEQKLNRLITGNDLVMNEGSDPVDLSKNKTSVKRNDNDRLQKSASFDIGDSVQIIWAKNFWTKRKMPESGLTGNVVKVSKEFVWVVLSNGETYKKKKHNVLKRN